MECAVVSQVKMFLGKLDILNLSGVWSSGRVGAEDINLEVIFTVMVFKAMQLGGSSGSSTFQSVSCHGPHRSWRDVSPETNHILRV